MVSVEGLKLKSTCMVNDVAIFAIFGKYCKCVNGKVGVDHVVGSPVS